MTLVPLRWHGVELAFLVAIVVAHRHFVTPSRERAKATAAVLCLAAVTLWPVGDIASSVSLSVATTQRLVIMLLVAPLLLLSLPVDRLVRLTRPRAVDAVVRRLVHPGLATIVVTILGTATLSPSVVDWAAASRFGEFAVVVTTLATGLVLWLPALAILPGTKRLSPTGRAAYVFVSALVVTSLSIVWIFARHPLYPALHHQYALLRMTPLLDQQVAGFIAKLGAYVPMWVVAFTIFSRADQQGIAVEESPLHWADVERELLRVDRQRARSARRARH